MLRYMGFLLAVGTVAVLTVAIGALFAMFGTSPFIQGNWIMWADDSTKLVTVMTGHLVLYSLWGTVSYRMFSRLGWSWRAPWLHVVIAWVVLAVIIWLAVFAVVTGRTTPEEAMAITAIVLATVGYGLHHFGQVRAGLRLMPGGDTGQFK